MPCLKENLLAFLSTAKSEQALKKTAPNKGFGVMVALRIYPHRYNTTQRNIQLTNKAQLEYIF
jgi:hypothetical protein